MDIDFSCDVCGQSLQSSRTVEKRGIVEVSVIPCETCLEEEKDRAHEEGNEEGYGDGYKEGYNEGYNEIYERHRIKDPDKE